MKTMVLKALSSVRENRTPLELVDMPDPMPGEGQILIEVSACGVCHTELDEIEERTLSPAFPVIPGHRVISRVAGLGENAHRSRGRDQVNEPSLLLLHIPGGILQQCGFQPSSLHRPPIQTFM